MNEHHLEPGQLRQWKKSVIVDLSQNIFVVLFTFERGKIEWVRLLMNNKIITMTAFTTRTASVAVK